ncbi:hypothetical protein FOZ61_000637 [Perkinsus olseni]|uniref:Uncharacterized protein n=1 Tax=Perkinsus olseni TaxID=32597 RepID=A0A7J6LZC4_PEROL|nr:hypothetical protein FOZ61_000637 [Perkinsus olseni]
MPLASKNAEATRETTTVWMSYKIPTDLNLALLLGCKTPDALALSCGLVEVGAFRDVLFLYGTRIATGHPTMATNHSSPQ